MDVAQAGEHALSFRPQGGHRQGGAAPGVGGADLTLSLPSVGCTENAMLAAVMARGTTTITNAAR